MTISVAEPPNVVIDRARANRAHGMTPATVRDACGDRLYVAPAFGHLWVVGMYWAAPVEILQAAARYLPAKMTTTPGSYALSKGRFEKTPALTVPDPEALLIGALARSTDPLIVTGRHVRNLDPAVVLADAHGTDRYAASTRYLRLLAGWGRYPDSGEAAIQSGHVVVTGAPGLAPLVLRQRRSWEDGSACDQLLGLLMPVHLAVRA